MRRYEAMREIMSVVTDELVVCTLGHPSQELYRLADRPRNLYMLGSMGLATSIGHGLALAQERKVLVIDGDAAVTMNLGGLATIGHRQPRNLVLVIIDNQANGSTGFQPSLTASRLRLDEVAKAAGIERVSLISEETIIADAVKAALESDEGPHVIVIRTLAGMPDGIGVIPIDGTAVKERFMKSIASSPPSLIPPAPRPRAADRRRRASRPGCA
jgi:sulfopyruvate decarboxylase subunit beta